MLKRQKVTFKVYTKSLLMMIETINRTMALDIGKSLRSVIVTEKDMN